MKDVFKCWKYQATVSHSLLWGDHFATSSGKADLIWIGQEQAGQKCWWSCVGGGRKGDAWATAKSGRQYLIQHDILQDKAIPFKFLATFESAGFWFISTSCHVTMDLLKSKIQCLNQDLPPTEPLL